MNEVGVGGLRSGGAELQGDLSAMVSRVEEDVSENVFDAAGPNLAFGVAILDVVVERAGREQIGEADEIIFVGAGDFLLQLETIVERKGWPDGQGLWLLQDALEPQLFGRENVSHAAQGAGWKWGRSFPSRRCIGGWPKSRR